MADYINKQNILSQAYIHVEPKLISNQEQLEDFKAYIIEFARTRADFFLKPDLKIEFDFQEGSIKARITIFGSLMLLVQGIASYPSFREGVGAIYADSKRLSEYIVSEAQYQTGSKHEDVIRLEARTGVIGSLHKITLQIDQIKRGAEGHTTAKDLSKKIIAVTRDIEELISFLEEPGDIFLVKTGLTSLVMEIRETPKAPKNKTNSSMSNIVYKNNLKKLIKLLSFKAEQ